MADSPMSQDDIDALLAGIGGDASPAEPQTAATQPTAADANPTVDQAELDQLLGALEVAGAAEQGSSKPPGTGAHAVAATPIVDQGDIDALLAALDPGSASDATEAVQTPAEPATNAPIGQEDIDQILAGLDAAAAAQSTNGDAALGQTDIDLLISQLSAAPPVAAPVPVAQSKPTGDTALGQSDIDLLISQMAGEAAASTAPVAGSATKVAPVAAAAPTAGATSKPSSSSTTSLDQAGIDDLLRSLGASDMSIGADRSTSQHDAPAVSPGGSKAGALGTPGSSRATLALTSEDLSALVNKHGAGGEQGEGADGMIGQEDIDALVKQLGTAGGGADSASKPSVTEQLAQHDAAIDQLLGNSGAPTVAATMDAVDVKSLAPGSSAQGGRPGPMLMPSTVPVMTPPELRGTRWLLAAAVLLLGVCAGTLVTVSRSIGALGDELRYERTQELASSDSYGDDFAAAVQRLASPDSEQITKGVLFLERLRKRYPSHAMEVSLVLAHHFRRHGAWKEASRAYADALVDGLPEGDPAPVLAYAESLVQLGQMDQARRQLFTLLSRESRYIGEDNRNRTGAEVERNRRTLMAAHLLLGRLLDGGGDPRLALAEKPSSADPEGGH